MNFQLTNKKLAIGLVVLLALAAAFALYDFQQKPETRPAETLIVKVFFGNSRLDPEVFDCRKVWPVERVMPKTPAVARAALEELFKGPTPQEKSGGYFTSINPGVTIQRLVIEGGTAYADFDRRLEDAVGGSCRVAAIRGQITETLRQFPTVNEVVVSIDGRTEDILQP